MKNKHIPEIRFSDFQDDWEQRKLGELATFSKGSGYTKNDLIEKGTPIVLYGRLYTNYQTVINDVDTFVEEKPKSVVSDGNEVVVPASGETSEDISRASVIGKSGLILGGDLNIIKPYKIIDSTFLALTISNGTQQKEMSKRAQGKSVVHLHNSDLKQVNLLYPKLEEQQKIGSFFQQLDDTIALHQRKLNQQQELKKAMLQKMFLKNGEKQPELRFSGFTEDWEQRKLGDIYNFQYGQFNNNPDNGGEYPVYGANGIIGGYHEYNAEDSVVIGHMGAYAGHVLWASGKHFVTYNGTIGFPKIKEFDKKFGYHMLQHLNIPKITAGSGQPFVSYADLENINISLPINLEEQQKIGSFFKQLDETIALRQRELDALKGTKKAFLQKMFI